MNAFSVEDCALVEVVTQQPLVMEFWVWT